MEKFVTLSGGAAAPILVVPSASEEADTGDFYRALFAKDHGCTNVTSLEVRSPADGARTDLVALAEKAGGIFFAGGDQRRITKALLGTPVGAALERAWRRGAAVAGTSAGTACMSPLMMTGDGDFTVFREKAVELWPGLGFLPGTILDQHFVARGRMNRLFSAVLEHPDLLGIGIDEGTAIWVRPGGTFEVMGAGWVVVVDAREVAITRRSAGKSTNLGARDLRVHILQKGDTFPLTDSSRTTR